MSTGQTPARGELGMTDLGTGRGREQSGTRPVLIVSVDGLNRSGAELVIMVPLTSRKKRIRTPREGPRQVPRATAAPRRLR